MAFNPKIIGPAEKINQSPEIYSVNRPENLSGSSWQHISQPVGRVLDSLRGHPFGGRQEPKFDPDTLERMRRLWEESDLPAKAIAERFGNSKNSVISLARRRGWKPRRAPSVPKISTLHDRMDALDEQMGVVLRQTVGVGRKQHKMPVRERLRQ